MMHRIHLPLYLCMFLSPSPVERKRQTNNNHRETIYKLLAFTFAMICGPLAAYFLSIKTFFSGMSPEASFIGLVR
jgi:hypothetical protein